MRFSSLIFAVVAASAVPACQGPFTTGGDHVDVLRDAACDPPTDPPLGSLLACASNDECLRYYRDHTPSGRVYGVCFEGYCQAAEECTETNAGAANHCRCGDTVTAHGCGGVCAAMGAAPKPMCVDACR